MGSAREIFKRRQARRRQAQAGVRGAARWLQAGGLIAAALLSAALLLGGSALVSAYAYYSRQLPEPGAYAAPGSEPTRLLDRTGQHVVVEVTDPLGADRTWVALSNIPESAREATIAIEDPAFHESAGYGAGKFARDLWNIVISGPRPSNLSITERLTQTLLIDPKEQTRPSSERRLKEAVLALRISQLYSQDAILEWHLNTRFYGNLAYGVEAASQVYFGKPLHELTLPEAAMLAAIPLAPELNPIDNYALAKERQGVVLQAMVEQETITAEEAEIAFAAPLEIMTAAQAQGSAAPRFAIAARKQLEDLVGPEMVYRGGLVVYTTLDYSLQLQAECAARTHLARLSGQPANVVIQAGDGSPCEAARFLPAPPPPSADYRASNAAAVVIEAKTGEVLAMIGGLDYGNSAIDGSVNMALAERPPGTAIAPFIYLTAFQQGHTPATMALDVPSTFDIGGDQPFAPENADRQFHGPMSLRAALANAYNVPAVQVMNWVGVDSAIRTAHAMGINGLDRGPESYGLALALNGGEATLLDLAYAYSVLANSGELRGTPIAEARLRPGFRAQDPTLILRVEDQAGNILWEYGKDGSFDRSAVVEPALAYLVTDILADDEARRPSVGANSALLLDRPAAAATGATLGQKDLWTVGYTPQIVTGVWVGSADNSPLADLSAIAGAAPIWKAVMAYAHQSLPVENWARPADIVEITVCSPSGLLPTPYCPAREEIFRRGTEPTHTDNVFQPFAINKETGLLATVYTPPELVEERVFQILPPEAAEWAQAAGIPQPPTAYDAATLPDATSEAAITDPGPFSYARGTVSIRGNARDAAFSAYRLDYGAGLNPAQWFQIGSENSTPVSDGLLGVWDTAGLEGLYSLRLTVIRSDSTFQQAVTQVTVDNIPPTIQIARPTDGQQFSVADGAALLLPDVSDNLAIERVEFYVDGELAATRTNAPFSARWTLAKPGAHVIQARAYDIAGNVTLSQTVTITIVP